jgi:hypothetical protein
LETSDTEIQAPTALPPVAELPRHEECGQCGAPVEKTQRYCVVCGFHRRHVTDPVARYLMRATAQTRHGSGTHSPARRRRSSNLGAALLLAVIPLAVGLGVLVGKSSTNGDSKLIAALRAQKPQVITTGGAGATGATSVSALSSSFPLQSGYSVELQTLPGRGATSSSVAGVEQAAKSKGAPKVGLILQSDFKVTPAPPAGALVIYSGTYKSRADAVKALAKLSKSFSGAKVIRVQGTGASTAGAGQVLTKTQYGTAHQITGFHATAAQLQQGAQVVKKIQSTEGKNYVGAQRGLPDQISIP